MPSLSTKIAQSIIISGLFIVVAFIAIYYQNPVSGFYFVIALLVFFIVAFGLAMGKTFAKPVRQILDQADDVSSGNVNKIFYLKTKDEVEDLARTFDKITRAFDKTKAEVESLRRIDEIKLKTKSLLSDQVIAALEGKIKNRTQDLETAASHLEILQNQLIEKEDQIKELESKVAKLGVKKKRATTKKDA